MSGISGWLGKSVPISEAGPTLERMGNRLADGRKARSPVLDARGSVICKGGTAVAGKAGDVMVAISGYPKLPGKPANEQLIRTIVACYREHGSAMLDRIHGPFSLALLDLEKNTALLAVDRLGIESLCYAVHGHTLVFGSRADSVASHPLADTTIDTQSVFDYLYFHFVPSPRSIYRGQQKLLPGQLIYYRDGQISSQFYWQMDYHDGPLPFQPLREECLDLLQDAVREAAGNDSPGAFLSGGLDSSTVTGLLSKINRGTTKTFSIGFEAEGYDEMEYARIASRHFGTSSSEYYVSPQDVVDAIPLVANACDEPFGNASAIPTFYCARLAKQEGINMLLAGDGGDEIFAGNTRYVQQLLLEQYQRIPGILRRAVLEPLAFHMPGIGRLPPVQKLRSYINQARIPLPDRMETYNFLHRSALDEIFTRDFLASVDADEPVRNLREVYNRTNSTSALNHMLDLDMKITLADNDLRKVNRMCELAGISVRYPMLDEKLVVFSGRIPAELKIRHFRLRHFFKHALKDFLPSETLSKSKQGFGLPFGIWLQDYQPLQDIVIDSLTSLKARDYVKAEYIDYLLHSHRDEHAAYYGVMIWVLMMLEQWLQKHGF